MLSSNSNYKNLSKQGQEIVQQKIARLTKTDDAKEIVSHVLESMNPLLEVEKINNTIIIGNGTLDRIKDRIRKANLSNYQKKKKTS